MYLNSNKTYVVDFFAYFLFLYMTPKWTAAYTGKYLCSYLRERKKLAGQINTINTVLPQSANHILHISQGVFYVGFIFFSNKAMSKTSVEKNEIFELHLSRTTRSVKTKQKTPILA